MKRRLPIALLAALLATHEAVAAEPVNFSREVLPILSDNCLSCHGQDESHRKAGRRLDTRDGATAEIDSVRAVVPGKPNESELLTRVLSKDRDEVMPPPKSHKPSLTAPQAEVLRRWIAEGAPWGKHWALEKPVRAKPPELRNPQSAIRTRAEREDSRQRARRVDAAASIHPIDSFVRARLQSEGLAPAPEAARHTLLRRLSFDLTGLPPTPEDLEVFLRESDWSHASDQSDQAYQRVVQRLLASPHFGERMAMWWLDAARYADTDGFQSDAERANWPWRDWVTSAFNSNMRFRTPR